MSTLYQIEPEGWVQIAREGAFPHTKGLNTFTREDLAACAAGFGAELLVDFEHESRTPDGSTEAAGWVQAVQQRDDGSLWAQVRWSDAGKTAVEGGRYRFCSPEFMSHQAADGWHPRQLAGLALTNRPNLKGLEPLSHRENPNTMNKIALALGLPETADEAAILAAIAALQVDKTEKEALIANRELAALGLEADADAKALLLAHREKAMPVLKALSDARNSLATAKAAAPERLLTHKATPPGETEGKTLRQQYEALPAGSAERTAFYKKHASALWGENA
jgi:phage I-like protein